MSFTLANANAVVVARQFNPSIVNQIWLVDNGLVDRNEFKDGCIFTDMLANVNTSRFVLFASPEQLQFTPVGDADYHQDVVSDVLRRIVETLPHTPYSAVGLNFVWHYHSEDVEASEVSRCLFYDGSRSLFRAFDTPDARFGAYLSKEALGARMKLDVKPIRVTLPNKKEVELMQFAFNYHMDIPQKQRDVQRLVDFLNRWDEARHLAAGILHTVEGGDHD